MKVPTRSAGGFRFRASLAVYILAIASVARTEELPVSIQIDTNAQRGMFGPVASPSAFAGWSSRQSQVAFLNDTDSMGMVRLNVEEAMTESTSLDDYKARLDALGQGWNMIEAKGGTIVITMARMPRWLSSKRFSLFSSRLADPAVPSGFRTYEASPPYKYNLWSQLVQATVERFSVELNLHPIYEVWNEPDLRAFWLGTTDDYLKLYRYAVLGARRADPSARLGGPATSGLEVRIEEDRTQSLLEEFIAYCAVTPLPELNYPRLPIDLVVWHHYSSNPTLGWADATDFVRQVLVANGFPETTPLAVDEWNYWADSEWSEPERDTEFGAAYVAAAIGAMTRAGVAYQSVAALEDFSDDASSPFHGDFGLMTYGSLLRKPSYLSVLALGKLEGGTELGTEVASPDFLTSAPTLEVLSSQQPNGDIVIVVWNFIPTLEGIVTLSMTGKGYDIDYLAQVVADSGSDVETLVNRAIMDPDFIAGLPYPASVQADLQEAVDDAVQGDVLRATSLRASVTVTGDPSAQYLMERYAIDSHRSNSYRAYEAAVSQGLTQAEAIEEARTHSALEQVEAYGPVSGDGLFPFEIEPFSVHLIVLEALD